jgi:cell division protein FtsL
VVVVVVVVVVVWMIHNKASSIETRRETTESARGSHTYQSIEQPNTSESNKSMCMW